MLLVNVERPIIRSAHVRKSNGIVGVGEARDNMIGWSFWSLLSLLGFPISTGNNCARLIHALLQFRVIQYASETNKFNPWQRPRADFFFGVNFLFKSRVNSTLDSREIRSKDFSLMRKRRLNFFSFSGYGPSTFFWVFSVDLFIFIFVWLNGSLCFAFLLEMKAFGINFPVYSTSNPHSNVYGVSSYFSLYFLPFFHFFTYCCNLVTLRSSPRGFA